MVLLLSVLAIASGSPGLWADEHKKIGESSAKETAKTETTKQRQSYTSVVPKALSENPCA